MGFNERRISLIMICVKSVTYSILFNWEPKGMIQPTRGIQQRDPLSHFLFLLCVEGLHDLVRQASSVGEIIVFSLCKQGPKLTHLLFVDDIFLFYKATLDECNKVMSLLAIYKYASSQKVNKNKIALFFSKYTLGDTRDLIKSILGVQEVHQYEKYLGLPSLVGRRKMLVSTISRQEYGKNYRVGKERYFLK